MLTSLSVIIAKHLPDETIIKSQKVTLHDSWSIKYLSKSHYWYLSPLDMTETQNYFFFDRRQPYLHTLSKQFLISPLVLGGFALFLWFYIWHQTPESFVLVIFAILLGFSVPITNYFINQGLSNIVVIKKKWVSENTKVDKEFVLKGTIPINKIYSFIDLLSSSTQKGLPLLDKIFGGYYSKNINSPSGISFTFKYQLT